MKIKLIKNAQMPKKGREGDAAWAVYLLDNCSIPANTGFCLDTGICLELDPGYAAIFVPRSSTAKKGIFISNCLIDSNYRGEIMVCLYNDSKEWQSVEYGDRIAQIVIIPYLQYDLNVVEELDETDRGENGFGSSGNN